MTGKNADRQLVQLIEEDAAIAARGIDFSELAGKRILVTGASGLLGIYFLASLAAGSAKGRPKVTAVIRSEPDFMLSYFAENLGATILRGDLSDQNFCNELPEADYMIQMAGYGQPTQFMADPVRTLKLNVSATLAMIEKLAPGGKFLFASSAEVYTGLSNPPFKEDEIGTTTTTHARFSYIEGKRGGEAICNAFRTKGVQAKSVRIALTYGPGTRQGDTRVLNSLIEKALKGNLQLMDRGEALRTFLYVGDAVAIMWKILFQGKEPIYNVGGKSRTSIFELAKMISQQTGVDVRLPTETPKSIAGAPALVELDMGRFEREFGAPSYTTLELGLKRTVDWQRILYSRAPSVN